MINIQNYTPELQAHMRATAEQALVLGGIERNCDVAVVEQLNAHSESLPVRAAREAIVATMVMGEAIEARFNELA